MVLPRSLMKLPYRLAFVLSSILAACSGGATATTDPSSPSRGATGGGDNDTGSEGAGTGSPPRASAGDRASIDGSDVASVVIGRGSCGSAAGYCNEATTTTTITFATATAATERCGDAGADTRTVSAAYLQRVRDALGALQLSDDPFENQDGMMSGLFVTDRRGERRAYSPDAACGHAQYTKVVGGWQELWDAAHAE